VTALLQQLGLLLQIPPNRHMAEVHPEDAQGDYHPSQTHAQHPEDGRQFAQSLGLIGLIHSLRIVAKGAAAMTAAIAIDLHTTIAVVPHRLPHLPPALKDIPLTIGAFLRTCFDPAFDIWQTKDYTGHDELLLMAC